MSGVAVTEPTEVRAPAPAPAARPRWLVRVLVAVLAVALVALGGGLAVATGIGRPAVPSDESVDAGFTRDMITHHTQAVQMAEVVRDHGSDPALRLLAYDIETQQLAQVGQMRGWLQSWGLPEQTDRARMAWMGSAAHAHDPAASAAGAPMPGMATTAEMARLRSLSGRALDVDFLQLMIRHHEGGLPMTQHAADHAGVTYVRDLAAKVASAQTSEVVTMEQVLREHGGEPLPPPS